MSYIRGFMVVIFHSAIDIFLVSLIQDAWKPIITAVINNREFRWLKQRLTGLTAETSLMNKIVEFAMYEHPIDIEKLRKSLHHQVRKRGIPRDGQLTHCGLVMPLIATEIWINVNSGNGLLPDKQQAITWTNVDLSPVGSWAMHLKAVALEMLNENNHYNAFENGISERPNPAWAMS